MGHGCGNSRDELTARTFFDLESCSFSGLFGDSVPVWAGLDALEEYIRGVMRPCARDARRLAGGGTLILKAVVLADGKAMDSGFEVESWEAAKGKLVVTSGGEQIRGASVICAGAAIMDDDVEIGRGVLVEPGAFIRGPSVIGDCTEVRQGAYIRGCALVGRNCVVGHATEVKSSVFLDGAKAGHFAYIGDSILGRDANLGAGTKLANLRIVPGNVIIPFESGRIDTGRRKLGAVLGDGTETGCNSVASPGSLMGRRCKVYPNATVAAGFYPQGSIVRPSGRPHGRTADRCPE